MRWNEILKEDVSVVQLVRVFVLDIVANLRNNDINHITVEQVIEQLTRIPELAGVQITPDLVITASENIKDVKVQNNPETGNLSIIIDQPETFAPGDQNSEVEDNRIKQAALRSVFKKIKS